MKVVCINNTSFYKLPNRDVISIDNYTNSKLPLSITIGKVYDVLDSSEELYNYEFEKERTYSIKDDFGEIRTFRINRFMALSEYRKMKLNKLESVSNGEVL